MWPEGAKFREARGQGAGGKDPWLRGPEQTGFGGSPLTTSKGRGRVVAVTHRLFQRGELWEDGGPATVTSVLRQAGFRREMGRVGGRVPVGGEGQVGAICHLGAVRESRWLPAGLCWRHSFCPHRGMLPRGLLPDR